MMIVMVVASAAANNGSVLVVVGEVDLDSRLRFSLHMNTMSHTQREKIVHNEKVCSILLLSY